MSGPESHNRSARHSVRQVIRVGHRGAAGHAPENTVAAIRAGIACGVEFVEIDLRRTADGALVALHDATVNRTTDGRGRISRLSLQEVKRLDAGNGTGIPTLEEALEAAAGQTGVMLELKVRGIAQQTVETVRRTGFTGSLLYASFLHDELMHVREGDPSASLMVLFDKLPPASVARAMKYASSHVGLRHSNATHRLVEAFHRTNFLVFVYTPNRPDDIRRALSLGVDGVISNFPDRIPHG